MNKLEFRQIQRILKINIVVLLLTSSYALAHSSQGTQDPSQLVSGEYRRLLRRIPTSVAENTDVCCGEMRCYKTECRYRYSFFGIKTVELKEKN